MRGVWRGTLLLGVRQQHALGRAWCDGGLSRFSGFRRFSQEGQAWVDPKAQPDEDVLAKYCRDLTELAREVEAEISFLVDSAVCRDVSTRSLDAKTTFAER
jgi:hypothetical protein